MYKFYSLQGYSDSEGSLCVECACKTYSGRVNQFISPYGTFNNRAAIVAGLKVLAERWPNETYNRYQENWGYSVNSDGTIGEYHKMQVRNMRRWLDCFVDAQAFGNAKVYDNEGTELYPITDDYESDYRLHCDTCAAEIPTYLRCHFGKLGEGDTCDCDDCREATEAEGKLPASRLAMHDAIVGVRDAKLALLGSAEHADSIFDAYDRLYDRAEDLCTLLRTARKDSQYARAKAIMDRAWILRLWGMHPDTGNDPYSYPNWRNGTGGYAK